MSRVAARTVTIALETLAELAEDRIALTDLSTRVGFSSNYLGRVLKRQRSLDLEKLFESVEQLGISQTAFLEVLTAKLGHAAPESLLAGLRPPGRPTDPFLEQLDGVELLEGAPDGGKIFDVRSELERLEDLRFKAPDQAKSELEALISFGSGTNDRPNLADRAVALASWAAIARLEGRPIDAFAALIRALAWARRANAPRAVAVCLQKSAYALCDVGFPAIGLRFLDWATHEFTAAGDQQSHPKVLVDRAFVFRAANDIDQAIYAYEAGLRVLPSDAWRYRYAAFQGLALCFESKGELNRACYFFDRAVTEYGDREDLFKPDLIWAHALILRNDGARGRAIGKLEEAVALYYRTKQPIKMALAGIDLCELLHNCKENEKVLVVTRQFMSWLPHFSSHKLARAAWTDFATMAQLGQMTNELITRTRQQLKRAQRPPSRGLRRHSSPRSRGSTIV
jgi:tetratricopeptide (TPR) repeat protein